MADFGVLDNPAFSDLFFFGFELRFDEAHALGLGREEGVESGEYKAEGDKGYVGCKKVRRPLEVFRRKVPNVCAFHDANALVLTKFPCQLAVAHVDGTDSGRAVLEETICEAACRCTDVDCVDAFHVDAKVL